MMPPMRLQLGQMMEKPPQGALEQACLQFEQQLYGSKGAHRSSKA
jgi:hypothetical protein